MIISACSDPIFYIISKEVPIVPPLIDGSPTNFVIFQGNIYVASGNNLYRYNNKTVDNKDSKRYGRGSWKTSFDKLPGGRIISLAVSDNYLYALCENNSGNRVIKRNASPESSSWSEIHADRNLQTFFIAKNELFICDINSEGSYNISHSAEGTINFSKINTGKRSLLHGVAADAANLYICTNNGIYNVGTLNVGAPAAVTTPKRISGNARTEYNQFFQGMLSLDNAAGTVVAITRDGVLYEVFPDRISKRASLNKEKSQRFRSTGTLATWTSGGRNLLLVGRMDTGYTTSSGHTYGYVEITYDNSGVERKYDKDGSTLATDKDGKRVYPDFRVPGKGSLTTVNNQERYISTIGVNPINHMIQAPDADSDRTLFAVTQKNGVWSLRVRNDGENKSKYWNAEE